MNLKQNIALIAASLALFSLALCDAGCTAAQKQTGISVAACLVGEVPSIVTEILPSVLDVIGGDNPDWQAALEAIGAKAGIGAVLCALDIVTHRMSSYPNIAPVAKANLFLAAHGVR